MRRLGTSSRSTHRRSAVGAVACAVLGVTSSAWAVNPLEYPDNGANAFSRGGAWLATASDPIAVHYNPAALATQASAASVDLRLNYAKVCFDRTDENGNPIGPDMELLPPNPDPSDPRGLQYKNTCNSRGAFPLTIPALALTWRATDDLGFGIGFVPPAAYGTANEGWPALAKVRNLQTGQDQLGPAPYRFMTLGNQSTIVFPTASVGWEAFDGFRLGAGFISGFAVINVMTGGISSVNEGQPYDRARQDSSSILRTKDLFMPGFVASILWSVTDTIDVGLWGRVVDGVKSDHGSLEVRTNYYAEAPYLAVNPDCSVFAADCGPATKNAFNFGPDEEQGTMQFEFPYPPPEVRAGVRYHQPRVKVRRRDDFGHEVRDPLHEDLFDVELDGSYTWNSVADEIKVRFPQNAAGQGLGIFPTGYVPPIADRATGFKDSWGLRLGGQFNVMQDKLGLMAGGWYESESQKPELLNVSPPGPERGGIGGGLVLRQEFVDITLGYQFHFKATLDNHGRGVQRSVAGTHPDGFSVLDEPLDLPAEDRREYRSVHVINNGKVTQMAHAFALGAVMRF
jgi:long-subunit fatty acid transport protein